MDTEILQAFVKEVLKDEKITDVKIESTIFKVSGRIRHRAGDTKGVMEFNKTYNFEFSV